MKRIKLTFVIVLITMSAMAQKEMRFGLKISPNIGFYRPQTKSLTAEGARMGFGYGLMSEFQIGDNYALAIDLGIASMGGKVNIPSVTYPSLGVGGITYTNVIYSYNTRYIEIPISLKMKTKEYNYLTYYGTFGIQPSVLINAKAEATSNGVSIAGTEKFILVNKSEDDKYNGTPFKDDAAIFRTSLVVGAGAEYSLSGKTALLAGIKYDSGFLNAFKTAGQKTFHTAFALNLGLLF